MYHRAMDWGCNDKLIVSLALQVTEEQLEIGTGIRMAENCLEIQAAEKKEREARNGKKKHHYDGWTVRLDGLGGLFQL